MFYIITMEAMLLSQKRHSFVTIQFERLYEFAQKSIIYIATFLMEMCLNLISTSINPISNIAILSRFFPRHRHKYQLTESKHFDF